MRIFETHTQKFQSPKKRKIRIKHKTFRFFQNHTLKFQDPKNYEKLGKNIKD